MSVGFGRQILVVTWLVAAGVSPASAIVHASDRLVYQEDYEGESGYPTAPEVDEIFASGLFGDSLSGGGMGPVLTGSAAHASVSMGGSELQGILLPLHELGSTPLRFRGRFSNLSMAPDSEGIVYLTTEFEGSARIEASVILGSFLSGTIDYGALEIRQRPVIGPPTLLSFPLSAAVLSALDGGAAFTIDLEFDRDLAVADASLLVSGVPIQTVGPLAIDPTTADLEVGLLVQSLGLGAGGDPTPVEVDFDGFELYRLFSTTFTVDTLADQVDSLPGDGSCSTASGFCSLRAAIQESNALPGYGEVVVPPGQYVLSIAGTLEDATASGDLDILDDLLIRGASRSSTIVDGAQLDRVFHVPFTSGSEMAQLMDLEITNGAAIIPGSLTGGGVENEERLDLIRCIVSNNQSNLAGGIMNRRRLNMDDCVVRGNEALDLGITNDKAGGLASGSTSGGGGPETRAFIRNSSIVNNIAAFVGGAEFGNADWATIENTTISGNTNAQVSVQSTDVRLRHVTIKSDLGAGLAASSFDDTIPLEFSNSAIEGFPACNLNTTAPQTWVYAGQNASNDTSCGFVAPGDVTGVSLDLGPLVMAGGTSWHLPAPGSPLIDSADTAECTSADQRGDRRPADGDASGTAECDLGAIEVPEPDMGLLIAWGVFGLGFAAAMRRSDSTSPFSRLGPAPPVVNENTLSPYAELAQATRP